MNKKIKILNSLFVITSILIYTALGYLLFYFYYDKGNIYIGLPLLLLGTSALVTLVTYISFSIKYKLSDAVSVVSLLLMLFFYGGTYLYTHINLYPLVNNSGFKNEKINDMVPGLSKKTHNFKIETNELITVGPEIVDCVGAFPQKCLIVDGEFFYDAIDGFEHEVGYAYELEIKRTQRCNPHLPNDCPQDVGIYQYSLVKEISKELVN